MHAGIANPRWRGKRSRHSGGKRNTQFYVSGKRPMDSVVRLSIEQQCILMYCQVLWTNIDQILEPCDAISRHHTTMKKLVPAIAHEEYFSRENALASMCAPHCIPVNMAYYVCWIWIWLEISSCRELVSNGVHYIKSQPTDPTSFEEMFHFDVLISSFTVYPMMFSHGYLELCFVLVTLT